MTMPTHDQSAKGGAAASRGAPDDTTSARERSPFGGAGGVRRKLARRVLLVAIPIATLVAVWLATRGRSPEQSAAGHAHGAAPSADSARPVMLTGDEAQRIGVTYTVATLGSLVTAFVQGTLVGVAFAIAGLPAPAVFGALAMIASLLPVVGAAVVWVPAAIILAAQHQWGWAVFLTVWCVSLVHSSDNVIRPLFISSRAKISTLPVFVGLIGGVSAFGAIGMFLGPVLIALFLALVEFWEDVRAVEEAPLAPRPPTQPT
jgi:hypothetical protein